MTSIRSSRFSKWLAISLAFSAVVGFSVQMRGQSAPAVPVGSVKITGIPDDWTHHHVVFANPGSEQDAIQSGHDVQWQKIVNEPRYVIQQLKNNLPVQGPAAADAEYRAQWISEATRGAAPFDPFGFRPHKGPIKRPGENSEIQRDWSMTSGGVGGLLPNHWPAKYGFSTTNAESCSDFVVFPTGIVGSSTQATLIAYKNLYKTTCGPTVPGILLSINTGGLAKTSPVLSLDGTQVAYVQTTSSGSVTATLNSTVNFTVTSGTLTSSEVGSLVSGTNIPTGDTIATVTSATAGTLTTAATGGGSHTLTITGTAQLVLLKIGTGGGTAVGSPLSPTVTTAANYRTCTGPCYTTFNFHSATAGTAPGDSNSAPFYVYGSGGTDPDLLYVGDNLGYVHKFTGVFVGTPPAEVTTGWPAHASTEGSPALNSPVYDSVSGNIFVGDVSGYLHQFAVGTTPGTVHVSGHLAYNTGGLTDPPIIDSTSPTDEAYQFVGYSDDTGHNRPSYINVFPAETALSGAADFGTSVYFPNALTYAEASRPASASTLMYAGTFDNTYFSGSGDTGNIYSCADGVVYQVEVATIGGTLKINVFNTPTSAVATCSPVSEFYNTTTSTDWIFMSVAASGNATVTPACAGACVYNYNVTTSTNTTGSPVDGLSATGGTSGVVIDNAASGGGSEIYFTSQGSETCGGNGSVGSGAGSCAVQATQSALQ